MAILTRDRRTPMRVVERSITETTGAGVYTASVSLPAGATILDITVSGVALWNTATSATLKVGDTASDNGFFTAVNLLATDLLAGEALTLFAPGGKQGAYIVPGIADDAYQVNRLYVATARVITAIVTTVGATGSAGRTRLMVAYAAPLAADVAAATKV